MPMNRYYIEKDSGETTRLLASLQNTARIARTHISRQLQSTGLYAGQDAIMELLAIEDGQTLGKLAATLGIKPPTVTRTISRLQEQAFVERRPSETDARQIHVWLTDAGRAVLEQMHGAVHEAEARALGGLKKKDRKQLAKLLARIETNLTSPAKTKAKKKSGSRGKKKSDKASA